MPSAQVKYDPQRALVLVGFLVFLPHFYLVHRLLFPEVAGSLFSFISFAATCRGILVRGFWSADFRMPCSSTIDRDAAGCSGHRPRSLGGGIQVIFARSARLPALTKQEHSGGAFRSCREWAHL